MIEHPEGKARIYEITLDTQSYEHRESNVYCERKRDATNVCIRFLNAEANYSRKHLRSH